MVKVDEKAKALKDLVLSQMFGTPRFLKVNEKIFGTGA